MIVEKLLVTHAELTQAITDACLKALKAGMEASDVQSVLTRIAELIEAGE